LNVKHKLC